VAAGRRGRAAIQAHGSPHYLGAAGKEERGAGLSTSLADRAGAAFRKEERGNAMNDPLEMANAIARNREINTAAERWIVNAFRAWWHDGSDPEKLATFLRLPSGKRKALATRNHWLRIAGDELPITTRAADLKRHVDAFLRHQWPAWRGNSIPPDDASELEKALFYAADSGAPLKLTRRQLCNVMSGNK